MLMIPRKGACTLVLCAILTSIPLQVSIAAPRNQKAGKPADRPPSSPPAPVAVQPLAEAHPPEPEDEIKLSQAAPMDGALNLTDDKKEKGPLREFRIFPAPFYAPETSLGIAVVTAYFFRFKNYPDARTSSNTAMAGATFNQQFSFTDQANIFFGNNDWYLYEYMQARLWPNQFFGVGPDVGMEPESFTQTSVTNTLRFQRRFLNYLYVGPQLTFFYSDQKDLLPGGKLASGTVPGSGNHMVGGAGISVAWDSRNSSTFPTRGGHYSLNTEWVQDLRGGPFSAPRTMITLKKFLSIAEDHIFAFKFQTVFGFEGEGQVPFTLMAALGGEDKLRGIVEPRFRDRSAVHAVIEYRLNLSKRWGTVVFGGLGQVAPSLLDLRWNKLQPSAGAGLRYAIVPDERVNLRLDIATSATGRFETYIAAGESF